MNATMSPTKKFGFWMAFFALVLLLLWVFQPVLTPFILGITIAYLLDPVMRRFARRQVPRWVTALVILTVFCASLTARACHTGANPWSATQFLATGKEPVLVCCDEQ